jgi:hypothetical protein
MSGIGVSVPARRANHLLVNAVIESDVLQCTSPQMAHRDISLRCEIRSLSGHCGHGRACGWLDLCRE